MKGIFLTLIATFALTGCGPDDNSNRVVGELASDRIELTAEFNEPIIEILVAEGASVISGQVLLRQNDARAQAHLADAEAVYLQSRARMDEMVRGPRSEQITAARATVEGATQDLDFRQSEQARIEDIHQRGLASADALDKANAALDAAQAMGLPDGFHERGTMTKCLCHFRAKLHTLLQVHVDDIRSTESVSQLLLASLLSFFLGSVLFHELLLNRTDQ